MNIDVAGFDDQMSGRIIEVCGRVQTFLAGRMSGSASNPPAPSGTRRPISPGKQRRRPDRPKRLTGLPAHGPGGTPTWYPAFLLFEEVSHCLLGRRGVPHDTAIGSWLVANLAIEQPVALVVDDAHWADLPSLRFLSFLAGRLDELAVLAVIAVRSSEPGTPELVQRLADDATVLRPSALSEEAVATLVRTHMEAGAAAEFRRACPPATGGTRA